MYQFSPFQANASAVENATVANDDADDVDVDRRRAITEEISIRIPRSAGHTLLLLCLLSPHLLLLAVNATRAILSCTRRLPSARTLAAYLASDACACTGVGLLVFVVAPRLDYVGRIFLGFVGGVAAPTFFDALSNLGGLRGKSNAASQRTVSSLCSASDFFFFFFFWHSFDNIKEKRLVAQRREEVRLLI